MRILALIFAASLLAGACSDDSDDSNSGPPKEATELLEREGYLDDNGSISIGPAGPSDDAVKAAMCDFLFGEPEQVGDRLGVDVTLAEGSGYQNLGGNGTGVACTYEQDGEAFFRIGLWSSDPTDAGADAVTVDVPSGDTGFAQYHPDHDGETLDEGDLIDWVEDAGSRYEGQSV